jgi:hypothetical protein
LGWIVSASKHSYLKWIAVVIGLLIIPSHLIWKPYFVMGIPLGIVFVHKIYEGKSFISLIGAALFFALINLTGFDFVGHEWGAQFEAGSVMLFMHLSLICAVAMHHERLDGSMMEKFSETS